MTNKQKYTTAEERVKAFNERCVRNIGNCINCPLGFRDCKETIECFAHWLDLEYEGEKPEPCPFCGGEVERAETLVGKKGFTCSCGYTSKAEFGWDKAIAAHNRVARAVEAAK